MTPLTEIGEESDQRKGKVGESNFVLVVRLVNLPAKAMGIAFMKYKMTGEAEETYNPHSADDDVIECGVEIFTK
jgi:hypothetical protein